ncbi:insecticidal toxin complex protein TcaB2 [Pseudomonas moraviensis]|uniref:Insecticidal toxin complex protein TcaB2 n=1 Tax=Pseudomonas moraviensis TaxID=321662 RepID=A0A2A2PPS9_9PSED|nr:neuraminidase-like domain-containing protein [Pseudomonas moraviensis]PAW52296.1 insecticidal toxin complex protein TcaB2 [Pseudomonas moraviensis]PAW57578.1 insecticidal toxin complex protein TcaB2 [Pseudomonas moraviensis]
MTQRKLSPLLEKRRAALVEYCIGQAARENYSFVKTPQDLFELLRMDPLDNYPVQSSWVAEATSCAQQFIHAAYRKLEPGYKDTVFPTEHLKLWELYSNYPDWAALTLIAYYPENFINPFVRQRKTRLFKALENDLNQTRLTDDSVRRALQEYLKAFEQTCNLDVISACLEGDSASRATYYFVGRQRVQPLQYYWRKADIDLTTAGNPVNPATWNEWQPVDIPVGGRVLDIRPLVWAGRLCLVWAEWSDQVGEKGANGYVPPKLDINLAFMSQNAEWSAPLSLYSADQDSDTSADARLLAMTLADDLIHPKGRLGVLLTSPAGLEVRATRDVLFRPLAEDNGTWLDHLANERFTDILTLQHSLTPKNQPVVAIKSETSGPLTGYYGLQAVFSEKGTEDFLWVRGLCRATGGNTGERAEFELALSNGAEGDPVPVKASESVAGGWATQWMELKRLKGGFTGLVEFSLSNAEQGSRQFTVSLTKITRFVPPTLEKNTLDAAQFIGFRQPGVLSRTRLNSLFGPELVQRSNVSVDAVLDWDTQFLTEPPPAAGPIDEPNGAFDGANGLYFWELFFHLPHLVATRLRAEDRYLEAQNWLHYVFDPQAVETSVEPKKPRFWRCRPLYSEGKVGHEAQMPTDPDAIAYAAPQHYQILLFTEYVRNLVAWGDWYYRQLTRDALVAAKLCYVQAEFLMGKPPSVRAVTRWQAQTVDDLLRQSTNRPALEQFEQELQFSPADIPPAAEASPLMGLLANEPFKLPINEQLLDLFDWPGQRLNNLRNNLTLDGKPLDVALFSPPTDPKQLLRDLAAGGVGLPRPMGGRLVVGAFRWRVTYEAALRAVQTLQEYGSQVLRLLEQRDRAEQEELQQEHLKELGDYARAVQEQSIAQLEAGLTALSQSQTMARQRDERYDAWYYEHISDAEYQVMEKLQAVKWMNAGTHAIKTGGAVVGALPNIFGVANGGHRPEKIADAVVYGLELGAMIVQVDADKQALTESYRLRRREWELQRDQALAEVAALAGQITAQTFAVEAARKSLEQTLRANGQALALYNYLKKRATNAELFGWLLGQLKALHYQAYDAVVSLCLSARASLSAETGNYDTVEALPQVWLDNRHGLTAGEHLREYLLRMDRLYLQSHERRLERVKTVSLRRLFDDRKDPQPGFSDWTQALKELTDKGTLEFQLTQLSFDRDHPGEYCRLINLVEVHTPGLLGSYQDLQATLLQIGSMIATQATAQSVEYLHRPAGKVAPDEVLFNLRSGQQIGLSAGIADTGMNASKPDEGLLNPFENTGAVSRWQLHFPWPTCERQASMLNSLTDIIVRVRYTAKAGEPTFTLAVKDLVTRALTSRSRNNQGADQHV